MIGPKIELTPFFSNIKNHPLKSFEKNSPGFLEEWYGAG
jgi:hypothetical protein